MHEHPITQPIRALSVFENETSSEYYEVGKNGVTKIEAVEKSGMHSHIPYIRVWKGDDFCHSEFCQHNVLGVYFDTSANPKGGDA